MKICFFGGTFNHRHWKEHPLKHREQWFPNFFSSNSLHDDDSNLGVEIPSCER